MAKIVYEAMAKNGTYTDKDGAEKNRWMKCGVVFEGDKGGLSLKLEAVPVANWDGWISLFEPKPKESAPQRRSSAKQQDDDSEIPF